MFTTLRLSQGSTVLLGHHNARKPRSLSGPIGQELGNPHERGPSIRQARLFDGAIAGRKPPYATVPFLNWAHFRRVSVTRWPAALPIGETKVRWRSVQARDSVPTRLSRR